MNRGIGMLQAGFHNGMSQIFLVCPRVFSPDSGIDFSQPEMFRICMLLEVENDQQLKPKTDFLSFRQDVTDFIMQQRYAATCRMLPVCA